MKNNIHKAEADMLHTALNIMELYDEENTEWFSVKKFKDWWNDTCRNS